MYNLEIVYLLHSQSILFFSISKYTFHIRRVYYKHSRSILLQSRRILFSFAKYTICSRKVYFSDYLSVLFTITKYTSLVLSTYHLCSRTILLPHHMNACIHQSCLPLCPAVRCLQHWIPTPVGVHSCLKSLP